MLIIFRNETGIALASLSHAIGDEDRRLPMDQPNPHVYDRISALGDDNPATGGDEQLATSPPASDPRGLVERNIAVVPNLAYRSLSTGAAPGLTTIRNE